MNLVKTPMFVRFLNNEVGATDLLMSFTSSEDPATASAAQKALANPPDLAPFKEELKGAITDLIKQGVGPEFKAFVDHYLECLEEDVEVEKTRVGENRSQIARVKNSDGPWVQAYICYNVCLYIKVYGLDDLKSCKICGKIFCHKGKYAVYCSEECKKKK